MWSHSMVTRLARKETGEKHSFFHNISLDCCWQTKFYDNCYNCLLFLLVFLGSAFLIFFPRE